MSDPLGEDVSVMHIEEFDPSMREERDAARQAAETYSNLAAGYKEALERVQRTAETWAERIVAHSAENMAYWVPVQECLNELRAALADQQEGPTG